MAYKINNFSEVNRTQWNSWVARIKETNYYHSWDWLNCLTKFSNIKENISFVLTDGSDDVLAICPLAISFFEQEGIYNISFGNFPCGMPALADMAPKLRRKLTDYIFSIVQSYVEKYKINKISMAWHPLNQLACLKDSLSYRYSFELLRYQMSYHVDNTLVMDLSLPEQEMTSSLSKYHYRHIKRARKKGVAVRVYNNKNNSDKTKYYFAKFQEAHFLSAGRMTRPQATWDAMYEGIINDAATLFVAFLEDNPISFLYCGEFSLMAFGWSQANIKEYEIKYAPRHILEWEAIVYYKKERNFKYYEVGERYFGPQFFHIPTDKEITIGIFKERYGGILLPKIKWTGYCDKDYMKADFDRHAKEFEGKDNLFKIPQE
jgi:hypothetical protein